MDPILTHTWWNKSTPKSGRDNSIVSTRDMTLTAEEKGQPRCKFCLTTTYSVRPEDSMRYDRKSCWRLMHSHGQFLERRLPEEKKESFQSLHLVIWSHFGSWWVCKTCKGSLVWWMILQSQYWLKHQSVKPLVCMCNRRCFTGRKEREPPSLVKLTRQEKIKKYTIVVTTY